MTDDERKEDEFKIKDEKDQDEIRLEVMRNKFFDMVFSEDGIHYDLSLIDEALFSAIDVMRIEGKSLLKKDLTFNYMITSVCMRWHADWEAYFPTPVDLRHIFARDFPSGILLLYSSIVHSGNRLARSLGYKKRTFNKETCDFLIDKGRMDPDEYSSILKLREYAREARTILIMDPPPKEVLLDCELIYQRMIFEVFNNQVCEEAKSKNN